MVNQTELHNIQTIEVWSELSMK